eukprot:TRINITY_DN31985_c0_g1_i1.p1 TRINITY_DN31985_c0_g1~~TRINITY_DN31985_c0_g1_i1.p1  ORF type:complete len:326 (+),score=92.84 TRINITY_DN31985_c0_g1_i1:61-1038(+)
MAIVAGAAVCSVAVLAKLRSMIQGYFWDRSADLPSGLSLSGQTVIVTGGNSGIGLASAKEFAKLGADVIIACRNAGRGQDAVREITSYVAGRRPKVTCLPLDTSDNASVREFVRKYEEVRSGPLRALVLNAGVGPQKGTGGQPARSGSGVELTFQTNHVGHFLLTQLMDKTIRADGTRVVAVSSGAHFWATVNFEDPGKEKDVYGQSKIAQVMHMKEQQRRYSEDGVQSLAVSCTPGFVRTNIFSSAPLVLRVLIFALYPIFVFLSRSPIMGCQVVVHCALANGIRGGAFYSNCVEKPARGRNGIANSTEAWTKLWDMSERMAKL